MTNKKHVVVLGNSGFPYGWAENQKIILIANCLLLTGNNVTVVCTNGIHTKKDHPDLKPHGKFEDVEYIYTSGDPYYNEKFISRNLLKVKGKINEFLYLKKRTKERKLDFAVLSTHSFTLVLYYSILGKLFGFKTILSYVEFHSKIPKKWYRFGTRLHDYLHDSYSARLVSGIFPISEFIINHFKKTSPDKKYLKIPNLTDYERFKNTEIIETEKYFMYCGAASYKEVVFFIIDAYNRLNTSSALLYLVINGTENDKTTIKNYINNTPQKDHIKVFSKLPESQLNSYYKNAIALLIPLRDTYQDIARFPHKIGEYFASGNPIISTNYGEVKFYFQDRKDLLLAEQYDIDLYAEKMQFVIDHPEEAKKIGIDGKNKAAPLFDYRIKAAAINNFLDSEF